VKYKYNLLKASTNTLNFNSHDSDYSSTMPHPPSADHEDTAAAARGPAVVVAPGDGQVPGTAE